MTIIVQQPKDSNGNPQPMVYDSDTGGIIVDHDGYVLMGMDKPLIDVPSKANFINTPKTQTSGIQEAIEALPTFYSPTAQQNVHIGKILFNSIANYYCTAPIYYTDGDMIEFEGLGGNVGAETSDQDFAPPPAIVSSSDTDGAIVVLQSAGTIYRGYGGGVNHWSNISIIHTEPITKIDKLANASVSATFSEHSTPAMNIFENVTIWDQSYSNMVLLLSTDTEDDVMILNNVFVLGSTWTAKDTAYLPANYLNTMVNIESNHLSSTYLLIYSRNSQPSTGLGFSNRNGVLLQATLNEDATFNNLMLIGTPNAWLNIGNSSGSTSGGNSAIFIGTLALEYDGDFPPPYYGINANGNYYAFVVQGNVPLKIGQISNSSFNSVSLMPPDSVYTALYSNLILPSGFTYLPAPTLSANPPVSGTVYQNTNPYDIRIYLPVYASTSGTAGTVAYGEDASSTVTEMTPKFISGSTSSTSVEIVDLVVPAGHYFEFTGSGVTFGTAVVKAA